MGIFRKLVMKHLATRSDKIFSEFGDVIIQTKKVIEESNQFDKPFKKLMINWLVSMPWAYFEGLFIDSNSWNEYLLKVFSKAQVINGEDCALITQAFILWHLEQLTKNDDNYKKYSIKEIELWINKGINKGNFLTHNLKKFRRNLKDLPPDYWYFEYINEILNATYTNHEETSTIISALQLNLELGLHLWTYSIDMIKTAKRIDAQK